MHLSGLGSTWPTSAPDVSKCGPNPCSWLDNMGSVIGESSQACADYMACALPNDPTTIALNKNLIAGVSAAVGEDVGGVVDSAAGGLGTGLMHSLNLPGYLAVGAAALLAFLVFSKR